MKLNVFLKRLYGIELYFHLTIMFILAFINAAALFFATYNLGFIIDAVSSGYKETIYHFYVILASVLVSIVCSVCIKYFGGGMRNRLCYKTRNKIGEKLCTAKYEEIEKIDDGELLSIATKDVEGLKGWLDVLIKMGCLPAQLGLVLIFAFKISWKYALFSLCFIPLAAIPEVFMSKKLNEYQAKEKKAYADMISFFTASIDYMLIVKSFLLEKLFIQKNKDVLRKNKKARMSRHLKTQLIDVYSRCFAHITNPLFLFVGAYFISIGEMSLGSVTNVILLANFIGEGIKVLIEIPVNYQGGKASAIHMKILLDIVDETTEEDEFLVENQNSEAPIFEVRDLEYMYDNRLVLKDVRFQVLKGEKIAIVGASGCGKTTLFKLLSGLYSSKKGQIYFKGQDISDVSLESLRRKITTTTQEAFIFHATFKDNIQIANPESNENEVVMAGEKAEIHSFIKSFEEGYHSIVNTTVQSISNGQMQRINLARAFLKNTEIFLLDEPTSALDAYTTKIILDKLFDEYADKTIMSIMHNVKELYRFDKVLMLADGNVVGFDTHESLINCCEQYRDLYNQGMRNGTEV